MKSLYVVRHGEAAYTSGAGDHGRPLTPRGARCAGELGAMLQRLGEAPDQLLSSDALRASATAELARSSGGWVAGVEHDPELYLAPPAGLMAAARAAHAGASRLVVVAHQPGLSDWVGQLLGAPGPRFAPGTVARVDLDLAEWGALGPGCGELLWCVGPGEAAAFRGSSGG